MNTIENIIPFSKESKERTEDRVEQDKPCSHGSKTREKLLKKINRANEIEEMMTFSKNLKLR
jgi:hypothetical protein